MKVIICQHEVKEVDVLCHPLLVGSLWDDDDTVLYQELQGYLCRCLAVFLANSQQRLVLEDAVSTLCQWTPCFQSRIIWFQVFQHLPLLVEYMRLTLVHDRHHLCTIHNFRECVRIEVRYTYSLEHTLLVEIFECMPHDGRIANRPVNKHQVHIVKPQLLHGMVNRA